MLYRPHGNPGSLLDTTKNDGPLATNLQPGGRPKTTPAQALARMKNAPKKKKTPPKPTG